MTWPEYMIWLIHHNEANAEPEPEEVGHDFFNNEVERLRKPQLGNPN